MSVVLDANGHANKETGTSPFTFTSLFTIGSSLTNPAALFYVLASPVTTFSSITCTWAGTNCPVIGSTQQSGFDALFLFGLTNPTSGPNNLVVTITGTLTTPFDVYATGVSFSGVNQTGGTTSFAHFNSSGGTGTTLSQTLAITTASGNYTIGCGSFGSSTGTGSTASSPGTNNEITNDSTGFGNSGISSLVAVNASTSTSTTYTFSQTPADVLHMIGCDIVAAASSSPVEALGTTIFKPLLRRYY